MRLTMRPVLPSRTITGSALSRLPLLLLLLLSLSAAAQERLRIVRPGKYTGMADASGAVPVGTNRFLVASDENNTLRLYAADNPGKPLQEFDFDSFLQIEGKNREADLEAAALLGNRAFWIGSHGRNKKGKDRPNRSRLFATEIKYEKGEVSVVPVGRPYKGLLDDLLAAPALAQFHLAEASTRAPKDEDALNIEGLSATPEGNLLIGFRNPVPNGKALLVPLLNPNQVISNETARLGKPLLLDLGGLGIRDLALYDKTYLIVAGAWHGGGPFHLFRWAGGTANPVPLEVKHLDNYHPEAVIIYPERGFREMLLLSDDGTRKLHGVPMKEVPPADQTFRSFWVVPDR